MSDKDITESKNSSVLNKLRGFRDQNGELLKKKTIVEREETKLNESTGKEEVTIITEEVDTVIQMKDYKTNKVHDVKLQSDAVDWIGESFFPKVEDKFHDGLAQVLDNTMNESVNMTSDHAPFKDKLPYLYRQAFSNFMMIDIVGFIPIDQPTTSVFIEKYFLGGDSENPIGDPILNKTMGVNGKLEYKSAAYRLAISDDFTEAEFNTVVTAVKTTGGSTAFVKKSDGTGNSLGKIKEIELMLEGNFATIVVDAEDGETLPSAGMIYLTTITKAVKATHKVDNDIAKNFLMRSYGFDYTTSDAENMKKQKSIGMSTASMDVTAKLHRLAFEITDEAVQDLLSRHKIDAKERLMTAIQYQLAANVNMRLFSLITTNAELVGEFTYRTAGGRHTLEKYNDLFIKISNEQIRMMAKNRRGIANKLICDIQTASIIKHGDGFVAANGGMGAGIVKIGAWQGMDIYVNTYSYLRFCLLTYKGNDNLIAPVFYMPYIGLYVAMAASFEDPNLKKIVFSERSAFSIHPDGSSQFATFFTVNHAGSILE